MGGGRRKPSASVKGRGENAGEKRKKKKTGMQKTKLSGRAYEKVGQSPVRTETSRGEERESNWNQRGPHLAFPQLGDAETGDAPKERKGKGSGSTSNGGELSW